MKSAGDIHRMSGGHSAAPCGHGVTQEAKQPAPARAARISATWCIRTSPRYQSVTIFTLLDSTGHAGAGQVAAGSNTYGNARGPDRCCFDFIIQDASRVSLPQHSHGVRDPL